MHSTERMSRRTSLWCGAWLVGCLWGCGGAAERSGETPAPDPQERSYNGVADSTDGGTPATTTNSVLPNPLLSGQIVASDNGSDEMFLIHLGKKHLIPSTAVLSSYGYAITQLRRVAAPVLSQMPRGVDLGYREGTLVKPANDTDVYVVDQVGFLPDAKWYKRWIVDQATFDDCRLPGVVVRTDDAILTAAYSEELSDISFCADDYLLDGTLLSPTDSDSIYVIQSGAEVDEPALSLLPSEAVRASHGYAGWRVAEVSPADFATYPRVEMTGYAEGTLIRLGGDPKAPYFVVEQRGPGFYRRQVLDECNLAYYGLNAQSAVLLSQPELDLHVLAEPLPDGCP